MKFTINLRALKSVVCAAGKEETRYYLKGVNFEPRVDAIYLCATDGHVLIAARHAYAIDETPLEDLPSFLIPTDLVKGLKLNKALDHGTVEFRDGVVFLHYAGTTVAAPAIDGSFPAWRQVVPETVDGVTAHYDPRLAMRFVDARDALVGKGDKVGVEIHQNGMNPALVSFAVAENDIDIFGVIMPIRGSSAVPIYTWAHRPKAAESKAA